MNKYLVIKDNYTAADIAALSPEARLYFTSSWIEKFKIESDKEKYEKIKNELLECGLFKYICD